MAKLTSYSRMLRGSFWPCYEALSQGTFNRVLVRGHKTVTENATASQADPAASASADAAAEQAKIAELEKAFATEKTDLTKQISDYKDKYMRSLAEAENVRQRMQKEISDAKLFGIQRFCKDLLEVADVLSTATSAVPKEQLKPDNPHLLNLHEGLTLTSSQLYKVFERNGLHKIEPAEGDKFDPYKHEALFQQPAPPGKESDTIAVVTKIGYMLHERTIRPALVGVFKTT